MENHQYKSGNHLTYEDEISISDIIKKIWVRRGILFICPVIFFIMGVIFLLVTAVKTNSPTIYYVQLKGIEKGLYPNGARFSPEDLLIPEVLKQAAKILNLSVDEKIVRAIQVEYGVPATAAIHVKYKQKLAEKLSPAEIEKVSDDYSSELESVGKQGLRIIVDHTSLGLSAEQGAVLAVSIPRAWSEVYTSKYRVFVDTRLDNVSIINIKNSLQNSADILMLHKSLEQIGRGLDLLNKDTRLKAIVTQSGLNSADLQSYLVRFQTIFFQPIFKGAFSKPDDILTSFVIETQFSINEIDSVIQELNRSLSDIKGLNVKTNEQNTIDRSGSSIDFSENSITKVIELANQASLSDYVKELLTHRRVLLEQKSVLETELARTKLNIELKDDSFLQKARDEFVFLTAEYISLLKIARDVRRQEYGDFYQPLGEPYVITSLFPPKTGLILAMSLILGCFLALMIALVWPQRK